ncbi:sensor histidine kinase [Runella slithyformis]|uniref:Signal transduction histidine kinase n=1 Tax=Runella slithyformis (strain ATCC 29530 / DSM 19594 / LMG 11500 / NCIMB 11436 / LSU 4) TaxID=761193 RepID=A0A7U4E6B9_RUNSL|nr:sensor histidine kinase [Runella slithyformis]AEI49108.1 putative signal transduction histidine kinase [Runella slithyformis DSM 19594]
MKKTCWAVAIHVLCCAAFLALPYLFAPNGFAQIAEIVHNPHERTNLLAYLFMLGFFYLNYYVLIPRLYFPQKYLLYTLGMIACFGVILLFLVAIDRRDVFSFRSEPSGLPQAFNRTHRPPPNFDKPRSEALPPAPPGLREKPPFGFELSHALFLFLVGVFVSLSLRINERLRRTEREKLNTELSFLKARINPHFLFNTLNTIYSLAIEQSSKTADAVVKLSALMRYVTQETDTDAVPLAGELTYIENYVALQKFRLDDTVIVDFSVKGHPNEQQIAPLILISFIENVFKYGVNPQETSVVQIQLSIAENRLHLRTFNKKVRVFYDEESTGGIGIENTKMRLRLMYPSQHLLTITDTPESFTVDLTLDL